MALFPQGLMNIWAGCRNAEVSGAERRVLQQLERCLDDDHLVWHNVPVGTRGSHPDFLILHPAKGLLILEVKGWRASALCKAGKTKVELETSRGLVTSIHPELQARGYAVELVNQMQRDPGLLATEGRHAGKLLVPWGWGAVLAYVDRADITDAQWGDVFPLERTLTKEDLSDDLDPGAFQERLWGMLPVSFRHTLTLPQRDRMRWHLSPEIRIHTQVSLLEDRNLRQFPGDALLQVMSLQMEQFARSIGDGHRVIHGVAGSGKTTTLVYRAEKLAANARPDWPILVLCFNKPLSVWINALIRARGIDERVQVRTFYDWCYDMASMYRLGIPKQGGKVDYDALAGYVLQAVELGRIPRAQYAALMIDEAQDFEDAWLRLAPQLIDPSTNNLLLLYGEQSIYRKRRSGAMFSFASLGIEARGRTSVLKINYRNTAEVLSLAIRTVGQLLAGAEPDDETGSDIAPQPPMAAGRRGPLPVLLRGRSPREEADLVAERIADVLAEGVMPADIGILARSHDLLDPVERALHDLGICTQRLKGADGKHWQSDSIKLTTLYASKGLEFNTVAIVGLQAVPDPRQTEDEEWRLLYVAMTRATHRLVLAGCGESGAVERVSGILGSTTSMPAPETLVVGPHSFSSHSHVVPRILGGGRRRDSCSSNTKDRPMSERDDLLASVANTIKTYREGELPEPTPAHVDRWLHQFTPAQQLPFLREFDHVLKESFFTRKNVKDFLRHLVTNTKLAGTDPAAYWSSAHFLTIQQNGQSQKEMLKLFAKCLEDECGLDIDGCGKAGGDFIYLDDVMFSGNRVGNDLEQWIVNKAPQSATVHVIVAALHSGGSYLVDKRLKTVVMQSGKKIAVKYWRALEIENRRWYKNSSGVLWPAAVPNAAEVQNYMALPSRFPFEPRQPGTATIAPFSSEAGRQVLESEFLIAGAKIRAMSENPKQSIRPLGFSQFGVGFGSMIVTYRNCPNNCPLAMWWGDPEATAGALHWYPLLSRKTYAAAENILNVFDDLTTL